MSLFFLYKRFCFLVHPPCGGNGFKAWPGGV
jgi:hypothetical protein